MRISVDQKDPGYVNYSKLESYVFQVFLDGKDITYDHKIMTVDEERGEVHVMWLDHRTNSFIVIDGVIQTHIFKGKVEIKFPDRSRDADACRGKFDGHMTFGGEPQRSPYRFKDFKVNVNKKP